MLSDVQKALNAVIRLEVAPPPGLRRPPGHHPFSAFRLSDSARANALTREFATLARQAFDGKKGAYEEKQAAAILAVVADVERRLRSGEEAEFVKHALKLLIVHHPIAAGLTIEPLEARHPHLVAPSSAPIPGTNGTVAAENGPEQALAYWREDPLINEHHEHWHIVFPIFGNPLKEGEPAIERQGELFWYMHEQMLARYDTERLSNGMQRVEPWADYRDIFSEQYGYNPGPVFLQNGWDRRLPGQQWSFQDNAPGLLQNDMANLSAMESWRDNLLTACESGVFELNGNRVTLTSDNLGATFEADKGTVDQAVISLYAVSDPTPQTTAELRATRYGELHNSGHDLFSMGASGQLVHNRQGGVMGFVPIAVRDPIFFRWHRHIDTIHQAWEEQWLPRRSAADFQSEVAPNVTIQADDILLVDESHLAHLKSEKEKERWGAQAFAGKHPHAVTGQLTTRMYTRVIKAEGGTSNPNTHTSYFPPDGIEISYLDQEPYAYFFRLNNSGKSDQNVTVRVFIAAQEQVENRRMWIEMDKFGVMAPPGETVVYRPASLSSVIRKPGVKPPQAYQQEEQYNGGGPQNREAFEKNYCNCGWPYNLLLPKGTEAGMSFKLLVLLTNGAQDQVLGDENCDCGSLSFCGARDQIYPDKRPMGYPFHAPFAGAITATFAQVQGAAMRDITIRHYSSPQ